MTPCDPMAVAVDWLDAYRDASLDQIVAMYGPDGVIECACGGRKIIQGAEGISAYWRHRFLQIPALELEELQMDGPWWSPTGPAAGSFRGCCTSLTMG
jgi:ketosteroid isomerase-like protein